MKFSGIKEKITGKTSAAYKKLNIEEKTDDFKEKIKNDERTEKIKNKVRYDENSVKVKKGLSKLKKNRKKIIALTVVCVIAFVLVAELAAVPVLYSLLFKGGSSKLLLAKKEDTSQRFAWAEEKFTDEYIESSDGLKLHAYYIKNENESGSYIIMCHPYGTDAKYMASYALHYYELGFNVLLCDARGCGQSEGAYIGMGWHDRLDIVSWAEKIISDDEDARIAVHGLGMGGTAALMASGEELPENVRMIVDDSGYMSVWDLVAYQTKNMFSLPSFPVVDLLSAYTKFRAGWDFKEASSIEQVKKSKTPTLFIHGGADSVVPLKEGNLLYDACTAKKRQMIMSSADFGQCEQVDSEKYWAEIDRFVLNNLGQIKQAN